MVYYEGAHNLPDASVLCVVQRAGHAQRDRDEVGPRR